MGARQSDDGRDVALRSTRPVRAALAVTITISLALLAGCGDDGDDGDDAASTTPESTAPADPVAGAQARVAAAEDGVTAASAAYDDAAAQFCGDTESYLQSLDRYGKLFTDGAATVGDVREAGADLVEPREAVGAAVDGVTDAREGVAAAQQELADATAALEAAIATASSLPAPPSTASAVTTTTLVPAALVEQVDAAETALEEAGAGITDDTPLSEATVEYNSAAFALQVTWAQVLLQAGCLDDEQQAAAYEQVRAYTATLQTQLLEAGYDPGQVDGIYGPKTVAAVKQLQADNGLRETGYVDRATADALAATLAEVAAEQADAAMTQTAVVQTVLTLAGFWTEPIDGEWTDELTNALVAFQTELGVPPTGEVDAATLAAFQQRLAELDAVITGATTTVPAPTTAPATAPPATATAPPTAAP